MKKIIAQLALISTSVLAETTCVATKVDASSKLNRTVVAKITSRLSKDQYRINFVGGAGEIDNCTFALKSHFIREEFTLVKCLSRAKFREKDVITYRLLFKKGKTTTRLSVQKRGESIANFICSRI